jgi:hypothetical protein
LDVFDGQKKLAKDVHLTNYYLGNGTEVRKVRGEVAVIKTILDDLYLEFDLGIADQVEVSATVIPLMSVLWLGTCSWLSASRAGLSIPGERTREAKVENPLPSKLCGQTIEIVVGPLRHLPISCHCEPRSCPIGWPPA